MKKKLLAGIAALALSVGALTTLTPAAPANAWPPPSGSFTIYYSPHCQNASRTYTTSNHASQYGEPWINDTFTSKAAGSAGYGQKIVKNAASAWVSRGTVQITFYNAGKRYQIAIGERSWQGQPANKCINFDDLAKKYGNKYRNANTHFAFITVQNI